MYCFIPIDVSIDTVGVRHGPRVVVGFIYIAFVRRVLLLASLVAIEPGSNGVERTRIRAIWDHTVGLLARCKVTGLRLRA